jgi:hypothetical protein
MSFAARARERFASRPPLLLFVPNRKPPIANGPTKKVEKRASCGEDPIQNQLVSYARSVSGSATSGGVTYQARVAAFFAAGILAEEAATAGFGLPTDAVLDTVWCETTDPVDDIKVTTCAGDVLLVQAKRTVTLATAEGSEFAKACRQLVASVQSAPDARLVLAVGPGSSRSVGVDLRELLDALRPQALTAPFRTAELSQSVKGAQEVLLGHLRREWRAQYAKRPTSSQLRSLLQRLRVAVLDVEPDGRAAPVHLAARRRRSRRRVDTADVDEHARGAAGAC